LLLRADTGDLLSLDVKSILGEALTTLTMELGINMTEELSNDLQASNQMKAIVASSMSELVKNMVRFSDYY
jgi:hypothetical protein